MSVQIYFLIFLSEMGHFGLLFFIVFCSIWLKLNKFKLPLTGLEPGSS